MAKITCDICGAAYAETENQCPICGTAKSDAAPVADPAAGEDGGYAYVKGGRFSKNNVKKRNSGNQDLPRTTVPEKPKQEPAPKQERPAPKERRAPVENKKEAKPEKKPMDRTEVAERRARRRQQEEERPNNIGLIIIAIILVLAFVACCAFLVMKWFEKEDPGNTEPETTGSHVSNHTTPSGPASSSGPVSIPCIGLRLPYAEYTFVDTASTLLLQPIVQPEDTTDEVKFGSSDERIATVDDKGLITPVADGVATIYVYCGSFRADLKVICNVGVEPEPTTQPTVPTEPTEPTEPEVVLELNRVDFTLSFYGDSWKLYSGPLDPRDITWTSSNEEVATVKDGVVTAVGNGKATITAEYKGQVATCVVRCANVKQPTETKYEIRTMYGPGYDIMLKVGESLKLYLEDKETGLRVPAADVKYWVETEGYVTVDEEGRVTGVSPKLAGVIVYIEYEGVVYEALVRVKSAN